MLRIVGATFTALLLTACAPSTLNGGPSAGHLRAEDAVKPQGNIPPPVQQIATLPKPRPAAKTETYSVVVNNIKVQDLLFALARDAKLNVDIHPGITGNVTMNAIDQTLPQLLSRIAKQVDMRFELDGPNLAVMPDTPYLKNYKIDYVNLARDVTGTVSTNTQISTSALSTTDAGGNSGNTSRIQIESKSKNRFWESLEKNLRDLLHETDKVFPEGSSETMTAQNSSLNASGTTAPLLSSTTSRGSRTAQTTVANTSAAAVENSGETVVRHMTFREAASVISNPEAGVITVRATSRQHEKVQEFIDRVMGSARRQVLIEATIIEVQLSDGYKQGIDWSRVTGGGQFGIASSSVGASVNNSVQPFALTYKGSNPLNYLDATVDLLRSFGTVKVLSSPKLSVLNNQTATLKVTEDYVYFNVKSDTTTTANVGTTIAVTTTPQSVSVGFFMSLTAQISDGDSVILNVRPSVSSIYGFADDPNPVLKILNQVPKIRTREIESLMRIESGDIAVLGGLMEDRQDNTTGRIPGAGDIPILGELFNKRANSSSKSELVVLLRPTVLKDASINGDFSSFKSSLPGKGFFVPAQIFQPFSVPEQRP